MTSVAPQARNGRAMIKLSDADNRLHQAAAARLLVRRRECAGHGTEQAGWKSPRQV